VIAAVDYARTKNVLTAIGGGDHMAAARVRMMAGLSSAAVAVPAGTPPAKGGGAIGVLAR